MSVYSPYQVEGVAAVWETPDADGHCLARGCFAESLRSFTSFPIFNAHKGSVVGVWDEVFEDEIGLHVRGMILRSGHEVSAKIKVGTIKGLSVTYVALHEHTTATGHRRITRASLGEISVAAQPAQAKARITKCVKLKSGGSSFDELHARIVALNISQSIQLAAIHKRLQDIKPEVAPAQPTVGKIGPDPVAAAMRAAGWL